jgi:hypothetical protein
MEQPILNQHPGDPQAAGSAGHFNKRSTFTLIVISFVFANLAYQYWTDLWCLAFIFPWYVQMAVICCLVDQRTRQKGIMGIYCTLTTMIMCLIIMYPMPWYLKSIIWVINSSIIVVGFYFILLLRCKDAQLDNKLDGEGERQGASEFYLGPEGKV